MNENVLRLLRSKNPLAIAVGILCLIFMAGWGVLAFAQKATSYMDQFETKENHKQDVEQKVSEFKKDVRIAILENNKVLLDELERRRRR